MCLLFVDQFRVGGVRVSGWGGNVSSLFDQQHSLGLGGFGFLGGGVMCLP